MIQSDEVQKQDPLLSRAEAKSMGLRWYFTGISCPRGHIAKRNVSNQECRQCVNDKRTLRRAAGLMADLDRRRYWKNPEKNRINGLLSRQKNIEARREYDRQRYHGDLERKAWQKSQAKAWGKANPGKRAAIVAARRRWIKRATPAWLTAEQHREIRVLYQIAAAREGEWHVDHIIPLRSKTVCGLNVPWNLQVITGDENRKKNTKYASE